MILLFVTNRGMPIM